MGWEGMLCPCHAFYCKQPWDTKCIKAVNCSTSAIRYYCVMFGWCMSCGEKRPRGWTFIPAKSFCCLLFLPTFFCGERSVGFLQDFNILKCYFSSSFWMKKEKIKKKIKAEIVCRGWSWDVCLQGCFGISDCNSPADGQLRFLPNTLWKPGHFPLENCRMFSIWLILTTIENKKAPTLNKCLLSKTNWDYVHGFAVFVWALGLCGYNIFQHWSLALDWFFLSFSVYVNEHVSDT